jgi:putative ABC transport system permease protein
VKGVYRSRLRPADVFRVGSVGLFSRKARAGLSAVGICIGIAAMVGVLGISSSSQAALLAQLDRLGTNLLSVSPGQTLGGGGTQLPPTAPGMIARIGPVQSVTSTGVVTNQTIRRTDKVSFASSGGIAIRATDPSLLSTLGGTLTDGVFLNGATVRYPAVVLGNGAARYLGIDHVTPGLQVYIGGQQSGAWFTVVGILDPLTLVPAVDRSALVGFPIAESLLGYDGWPTEIFLRSDPAQTAAVESVLARSVEPGSPDQVQVSRPSDVLAARAAAQTAYTSLFLGLGSIALLVGGVSIANTMLVAVLERRSEIGLRRALGATEPHIAVQFLAEALLLSGIGGLLGVVVGASSTAAYAIIKGWTVVVPQQAVWGGLAAALIVGAAAGLYPALRAARLPPTDALRTA